MASLRKFFGKGKQGSPIKKFDKKEENYPFKPFSLTRVAADELAAAYSGLRLTKKI